MENSTVKSILLLLGWGCIIAGVIVGMFMLGTLSDRATGGEQFAAFIIPTLIGVFSSVGFFWMHVVVRELERINMNLNSLRSGGTSGRSTGNASTPVPVTKPKGVCRDCGEKLLDGASFCTECGSRSIT